MLAISGGVLLAVGLLFLAAPHVAIDNWQWLLTPLTARVTGAVIGMYATVWLAVGVHNTSAGLESHCRRR